MPDTPKIHVRVSIRAQEALQRSSELIHRTNALLAKNRAFLNELDSIVLGNNQPMQGESNRVSGTAHPTLQWILHSALQITNANMANIQLVETTSGSLHIAAHHGFCRPFLDYFAYVHQGEAACGAALETQKRVVVEDVTKSPIFRRRPALEILLDAGVRAVQSTPLISRSGSLLGMLSTHWTSPHRPTDEELLHLDVLARTAADCLKLGDHT